MRRLAVLALMIVIAAPSARADGPSGPETGLWPFVEDGVFHGGVVTSGLVLVDGGGARLTPLGALGSAAPRWFHRAHDGRVLAGTAAGVLATSDLGCSWAAVAALPAQATTLGRDPFATDRLIVGTDAPAGENALFESNDGGLTFAARAWPPAERVLAAAAASGLIVILTPSGLTCTVGNTEPVRCRADVTAYTDLRLLGAGADGAIYLAGTTADGEVLLASRDALMSVSRVASFPKSTFVFSSRRIAALGEAASRLFVLTAPDQLSGQASDGTFEPLTARARCLTSTGGALWRCVSADDGALFSTSSDGTTWQPVLEPPAHMFEARSCTPAPPPPDVGSFGEPGPSGGGGGTLISGCQTTPGHRGSAIWLLILLGSLSRLKSRLFA